MQNAFILGAGLGNRLRPLTERLPKPLVPLFHRPLAEWTIDACNRIGINRFAINTHHLPNAWAGFGSGKDLTFFHEPVLLETGGGLKNCAAWMSGDPLLVHNGDIFSTLPLERLIEAHHASGLPVTLALRSAGSAKHIALDASKSRVTDIRNQLGRSEGTHVFTGIYCVNPSFLDWIPAGEKFSVIPAFLELAKMSQLGAIVLDEGVWLDLGDRDSYLQAHRELSLEPAIHPEANIEGGAIIERSVVGRGASVAAGAVIRDSIVWPGGRVASSARLERCIVYSQDLIQGTHENQDL
ncbi:MAG: sugar phosphate nucleotidyltransferase [Akkermansiaceae bacterium]|nr:sugar phosphate nucleotidyltransferase [Akkermansiaceae bacterium]